MKRTNLLVLLLMAGASLSAQQRQEITLSDDWQFYAETTTGDAAAKGEPQWQTVSVPHDWAISGPFDKKWDLQRVAIEQNGETEATEKSGRSGALPWIGEGHYKRKFTIPSGFQGHAELLFDGAMAEPTVFVNGQKAGYWAYGYNAFRVDITPYIKKGERSGRSSSDENLLTSSEENELTVDLKNVEESSRWYPGAGIYRPVTLILTPTKTYIDDWSIFIKPADNKKVKAGERVPMKVNFEIQNPTENLRYAVDVLDEKVHSVMKGGDEKHALEFANGKVALYFPVNNARLWSPESPALYQLVISLYDGDKMIDQKTQRFGIRTVSVSQNGGFQLNGQTRKIKGVCLHHDLGPLGAAINKAALIRQIKIMKDMGCDAIRTSHNMPSQWQMEICDSLGMMVMAESFDMWGYPKCKNGYARFFSTWSDRDITNLILANRNHPSIIMWSIGNEIPEQGSDEGRRISAHLQDLCHQLDPTRPVTQGMDKAEAALGSGFAQVMDVPGFNYRVHKYNKNLSQLWQGFLLGSETASTVSSRGVYKFPVVPDDNSRYASWAKGYDPNAIKTADGQCSGYDVEYCSWSNLPDDDWRWQDDMPWVIGEFVWTGFDYLGEPSPYDEYWPSRSSYFGICDLAGLPKDRYYLYRSHWQKEQHTIHLLPHWTWGKSRRGEVTPVYCYTDYPEAELFLNGKSQGRIKKLQEQPGQWNNASKAEQEKTRLDRYRLRWNEVKYEPGELRVVVFDENGKKCGEQTMKTAGKPTRLQLDVWTQSTPSSPSNQNSQSTQSNPNNQSSQSILKADGQDLAFVTVSLTDKDGTLIPDAQDQLVFKVTGAGTFRGVCNGDATSLESFTEPTMKLFNGQLVVVVQAGRETGNLTLEVSDKQRKLKQRISIPVSD